MSEEMIPDVMVQASDVPETAAAQAPEVAAAPVETAEETVNYADKSLAELVELFQGLAQDEDRMKKAKEAEAIKSAFYRKLLKEKTDAAIPEDADSSRNPFDAIEEGFKSLYAEFKKERAEFNKQQEQAREDEEV